MNMTRPNILWIYIEDQDPQYGCYGQRLVKTPHIDTLAEQGVLFERAYAPAPVCSPSRSAVITGSYAIRLGTHVQRSARFPGEEIYLPDGVRTVPELFREAGYFTFNQGKDDYNFTYDRASLYSTGNDSEDPGIAKGVQAGSGDFNECPAGMPFFAQVQTNGGKNGYSFEQATNVMQQLGVESPKLVSADDVTVPPQYPDIPEMRTMVAEQLSTMLVSDIEVGQLVVRLKAAGHWGNTIIFLVSDHGALFPRAKQMCYEEGLHVPLIIAAPGMAHLQSRIAPGCRYRAPAATLDIGATALALAGIPVPGYMDSTDLFSTEREHVFSARDRCEWAVDRTRSVIRDRYHYFRNFMTDRPLAQHNYRSGWPAFVKIEEMYERGELTPAQALPYGARPAEELYDLQNDPHELVNLAGDTAHRQELLLMRQLVEDWIKDTDDKGQYPDQRAGLEITKRLYPKMCIDPVFADL